MEGIGIFYPLFCFFGDAMGFLSGIKEFFSGKAMVTSDSTSYPSLWIDIDDNNTGQTVNVWSALRQATVLQCVTLISNGIAQIPFRLMDREHKVADTNPLYFLFKENPNRWQSSFDFWKLIGFHLALQGVCIVWVIRSRGVIQELIPFPPHRYSINVRYQNGWAVRDFTIIKDDGTLVTVPEKDAMGRTNIWELRWRDWDVNVGIPQLDLVRQVVAIALAGDDLSGSTFKNGARYSGLLMAKQILTPEQSKRIREEWVKEYGGSSNAGKTMLLGADFDYKTITQTNSDAQFIEQKKFQIEEICRAWNINPLLVFYFDNTTSYSNAEQMMVQHVVHTMGPWYRNLEESAYVNLLTEEERRRDGLYFAFNDSALMRTDARTRAEFYRSLFNIGSITPNEIRALEDMPPMEGGDELYIQGAVVPLKDAGKWQHTEDNTDSVDEEEDDSSNSEAVNEDNNND